MDFLQKPLVWFSKIYLSVQSKNCGRNSFFCFSFQKFFELWAKNFQTMAKKLQQFVKTTFYVSRGTNCGLNFFRFRIVLDFLQKPSAWFPKFYIRVQSKNCGRNSFLFFFSEFFRILSEKFFRLSAKILQEVVKTTFCTSTGTFSDFNFF